jgi:hypothetical protein
VAESATLTPEALQQDARLPELYRLVEEQLNDLSVVKIKVYNLEGITVFSTEMAQIGDSQAGQCRFPGGTIREVVASELTHRETFSAFRAGNLGPGRVFQLRADLCQRRQRPNCWRV